MTYYSPTPISELDKDGPQIFYYEMEGIEPWHRIRIFRGGKIEKSHAKEPDPVAWLKPVTGVLMEDSENEFILDALNAYGHQAREKLERPDELGTIEERNYKAQLQKARELMNKYS